MKTVSVKTKPQAKPVTKRVKITRCKLSKKEQQKMIEFFVLGVTARSAADLMEMQPNTAALFYRKIREVIAHYLAQDASQTFNGDFVLDESYFGESRTSKKYKADEDKHAVFGILSRDGKIFTRLTGQTNAELLTAVAPNLLVPDSVVYINGYHADQALDVNEFYQERVSQVDDPEHAKYLIGETENFWNQTKRMLRKYNGIPKTTFPLFLKECEFRFNYGTPKQQLKTLKQWTGV
jgi:transposase